MEGKAIVAVLASGSSGNCTYVGDGRAGLLVDCGMSARQIVSRMRQVGLEDAPVDGVLITHEHGDHVGAAQALCDTLTRRRGQAVPFYMTAGTRSRLRPRTTPDAAEVIEAGRPFAVRHLSVDPFSIPHDTADPVAYRIRVGGVWVGVITDLGEPTPLVTDKLSSLTVALLEFNHDLALLDGGPYPLPLKQRIRSAHGHLSNDQAAEILGQALGPTLRHLVLAHLSEANNQPRLALARATEVLARQRATRAVQLHVATQATPLAPIPVPTRPS